MKTKTATASAVQGTEAGKETNALTVVEKPKTITEKIDHLLAFEALASKHEYLKEVKQNLEEFGTGDDGFHGAKIVLTCNYKDVKVSNPAIMEEVTKILRMRIKEAVIKTENEIMAFTL